MWTRRNRENVLLQHSICCIFFLLLASCVQTPRSIGEPIELPVVIPTGDDFKIDRSMKIQRGVYRFEDVADDGILQIVSNDVTVDLSGVVLVGSAPAASPDSLRGIGVRAENVDGITIRHGTIQGFRVALEISGGENHKVVGTEFSENFRQRLHSTPDLENSEDWLRPRQNHDDQWARSYGAAIHLRRAAKTIIEGIRVRQGQNGILLSRCHEVTVRDCDASFLSGWGLALWRTVDSRITDNHFDFCVRGYSHGVYHRGQNSSGILVFEQSSRNHFNRNTATHSGNGLCLYAGEETVRVTGVGGSSFNSLTSNDFSHAVDNGIEATFSSGNRFEGNTLRDCGNGVSLEYSSDTVICRNDIEASSKAGITIEHGQRDQIFFNRFRSNPVAVSISCDQDAQFSSTAFVRSRSSDSRDHSIDQNEFIGDDIAISLKDTVATRIGENSYRDVREPLRQAGRGQAETDIDAEEVTQLSQEILPAPPDSPHHRQTHQGRDRIFVDAWGPYDYRGIRAWPPQISDSGNARVHLLGPNVPYRIEAISGEVTVTPTTGVLPKTVLIAPQKGQIGLIPFTCVVLTHDGEITFGGTLFSIPWQVAYYNWKPTGRFDPPRDFRKLTENPPLARESRSRLNLQPRSGAPLENVPADHFAVRATSEFQVREALYKLRVSSDDGDRVRLDGETIYEDWTWHPIRTESREVHLTASPHLLEVEYFEMTGDATLIVDLIPVDSTP